MESSRTEDQLSITRVIQLVARAYDHKRHDELILQLFEDNAKQHYYLLGQFVDFSMPGGVAAVKGYHDLCYATQHVVSPPVIDFEGERLARATSAVHAVHVQIRDDGTRSTWILGGYYHDVMAHGEGWRIRERVARATHEIGTFLTEGVRLYPTLPDYAEMGQV